MKKFLMVILASLVPLTSFATDSVKINFDTAKSDIRASEAAKLDAAAKQIKDDKAVVVIVGHADKRGGRLYNLDLGRKRAESVQKALKDRGVKDEQLIVSVSYGKEKPLAPNDGLAAHLQANRRVEITPIKALASREIIKEVPITTYVDREKRVEVKAYRKNRLSLLGGVGPMTLDKTTISKTHFRIDQNYEPVFGLGYARSLNSRFSIGGAAFTNNSYFLTLGLDF